MVKVLTPRDEAMLAVAKSLLDGEGIPYLVQNDADLGYSLAVSDPYFGKAVYVRDDDAARAAGILNGLEEGAGTAVDDRGKRSPLPLWRAILRIFVG